MSSSNWSVPMWSPLRSTDFIRTPPNTPSMSKSSLRENILNIDFHPVSQKEPFPSAQGSFAKQGRPALHEKYPQIVLAVRQYLQDQGWAAHQRRSTQVTVGTSLSQIRNYVMEEVPGLSDCGISESTVSRLMDPPHKKRKTAPLHKRLVHARVGMKRNNLSKAHVDSHFCQSQVNYALEMAACFSEEVSS